MTCHEVRQLWSLYHDSEGNAETHLALSRHLSMCLDCEEWFHTQSSFEKKLTARLVERKADPALWAKVYAGAGVTPATRPSKAKVVLAGLAIAALVIAMIWVKSHSWPSRESDLAVAAADWHERLESGQEPFQFTSQSDREVESFLKGRSPFPVRCPPRKDAGFTVRGAGVSQIEGRPAAYLNGTVKDAPVSILVLSRDSLSAFPTQQTALRKHGIMHTPAGPYAVVLREFDQNAIVVVGRIEPGALERVVNAYGSYPDHD